MVKSTMMLRNRSGQFTYEYQAKKDDYFYQQL